MVVQRGDIWWASLPEPAGSMPGYRRPVLIVQADSLNRSRIYTVIIVAITSNLRYAALPGNIRLSSRSTGLPRDSVANVSQLLAVDRSFLTEQVGQLSVGEMKRVDDGLRLVLSL
jgi:mRNA interferase MazF